MKSLLFLLVAVAMILLAIPIYAPAAEPTPVLTTEFVGHDAAVYRLASKPDMICDGVTCRPAPKEAPPEPTPAPCCSPPATPSTVTHSVMKQRQGFFGSGLRTRWANRPKLFGRFRGSCGCG